MEHIGERIKIIRKMYNIKQKEFAERVSVSASYISKVESGKEVPTDMLLKLIALDFKISLDWLKDGIGEIKESSKGFDTITDEGLNSKYQTMKDFLEKQIVEQTGDNLKNIVQAYSHFVSLVTMPGLNNDNQSRYLEALHGVIDILEQITYSSYMLKSVSDNNYKALLQHKTKVDTGISKIDDDIKKAKKIMADVMKKSEYGIKPEEEVVVVKELADSSIILEMRMWVKTEDYWNAKFYLNENVKYKFDENNISIPFNQLDVNLKNVQ